MSNQGGLGIGDGAGRPENGYNGGGNRRYRQNLAGFSQRRKVQVAESEADDEGFRLDDNSWPAVTLADRNITQKVTAGSCFLPRQGVCGDFSAKGGVQRSQESRGN